MNSVLVSGTIGIIAFAGMMYLIVRRHNAATHRPLSDVKKNAQPSQTTELGMEAIDMDLINQVENANRQSGLLTSVNTWGRSHTHLHSQNPKFKLPKDKP